MAGDILLTRMGCGLFPVSSCDHCNTRHPTQHQCVQVSPGSHIVDQKNDNRICGKAFCHMCKLQWGSESSSYCHLHLEGHGSTTLASPPTTNPVVEHPPFITAPLRSMQLCRETSSVCSLSKDSDNSNVILANLASSNGVSAIAEDDAHDNALVSSAIFPDSSDISEAFSSLAK